MLVVLAPVAGTVRDLADVPDAVFATAMVGPGAAVEPVDGVAVAPVTGVVVAAHPHAVVVRADADPAQADRAHPDRAHPDQPRDVLVHLGVDTVGLGGAGFTLLAAVGERVEAGAPLVRWSPDDVRAAGLSALCPVVALQADPAGVRTLVPPGGAVEAGAPLLAWT